MSRHLMLRDGHSLCGLEDGYSIATDFCDVTCPACREGYAEIYEHWMGYPPPPTQPRPAPCSYGMLILWGVLLVIVLLAVIR